MCTTVLWCERRGKSCLKHPAGLGRGTTHCGDKGNEVQGWGGEHARIESQNLSVIQRLPHGLLQFFSVTHCRHFPPVTKGDDIFSIFSRPGETDLEETSL